MCDRLPRRHGGRYRHAAVLRRRTGRGRLRAYSSDVVHTGGVGTAQVAKAANNLVLWACLVADHEALALARAHDMDIDVLRKALMMSSAQNHALEVWGQQSMAWADEHGPRFRVVPHPPLSPEGRGSRAR